MKKELKDFLVYTYFGIIPEDIYKQGDNKEEEYTDYLIKRIIMKAYGDATNEGAFNALIKKENVGLRKSSDKVKKISSKLLLERLKKLNSVPKFDEWHKELCKDIKKEYKDIKEDGKELFTYGNAQKWVNMSLKYMWLLELLPQNISEKDLHIPIDSYIIDALWWDNPDVILPIKPNNSPDRKHNYAKPSEYVIPWSKWDDDKTYNDLSDCLKGKYNLSWENESWIKTAEKRKAKEKKNTYDSFFGNDEK